MKNQIYESALHYDFINNFDFDVPFYEKLARKTGDSILELACGTGRVCIPLAEKGFEISGLDNALPLIDAAKEKASHKKLSIDFKVGSMIDFSFDKKFDLILCVHNSITHVETLIEMKSFLSCVDKHLKKEGRFIVQVFTPNMDILNRDPDHKLPLINYKLPNETDEIQVYESSWYEDESQMNYVKWHFEKNGKIEFIQNFTTRIYYPKELDHLFELLGFEIEHKYGDYDETLYEDYPDTQIFVLKKA